LERQRILRRVFRNFPIGFLDWRRALQFSRDPAIDAKWFRSYEVSNFGAENHIDIQKIGRPDNQYDFISLNHVLEFVPDDKSAFLELLRILSSSGFIQACFSSPLARDRTRAHKAWHLYGRDLPQHFSCPARGVTTMEIEDEDSCTGAREVMHFFFKTAAVATEMERWLSTSPTVRCSIVKA
jgi:ubiquinone/menaquinone biosynthesis C-methylase UbiE